MINSTRSLAPPESPLQGLPRRTPAEVRTRLSQIVTATGGWLRESGDRYWLLSWCHALTITGWPTRQEAEVEAQLLHTLTCGPDCRQWHAVLDMHTLRYVGASLFETFCRSLPSALNVLAQGPLLTPIPGSRGRHVQVAGLKRHAPQLDFWPGPIYWRIAWGVGTYLHGGLWPALVAASGIDAVMQWFAYEVTSQPQWQHPGMELRPGRVWDTWPRVVAVHFVPALHTFLSDVVEKIARVHAQEFAHYV